MYNAFRSGMTAWRIGVNFNDNPFKTEPEKTQWIKGWQKKNNEWNQKRRHIKKNFWRVRTNA